MGRLPRVFISYSHDSPEHRARVLRLSERLRADGVETCLDQYVNGTPTEGWPRWMLNQIDWAEHVLLICTATYYRRFRGHEDPGKGKGVDWEGAVITQELYDARSNTTRFVPVLFDAADEPYVPEPVRGHTFHVLTAEQTYAALYDFLLDQAGFEPGPVGEPKRKPRPRAVPLVFPDAGGGPGGPSAGAVSPPSPKVDLTTVSSSKPVATPRLLSIPSESFIPGILAPSMLLRAAARAVPYRPRHTLDVDFDQWLDDSHFFSIRMISGSGGAGKTRFAIELCIRRQSLEWTAGFLAEEETFRESAFLECIGASANLLIVVDYAEARVNDIEALIYYVAMRSHDQPELRIRLLLLTREQEKTIRILERAARPMARALWDHAYSDSESVALDPLDPDYKSRHAHYNAAVKALSGALNCQRTQTPAVDLSDEAYRNPLFVQIAALAAVDTEPFSTQKNSEEKLLIWLLSHERSYWHRFVVVDRACREIVEATEILLAFATLWGGCTRSEIVSLYEKLTANGDCPYVPLDRVFCILSSSYGATGTIPPLAPDRLGETLVAEIIKQDPDLLTRFALDESVQPKHILSVFRVLARLSGWQSDGSRLYEMAFTHDPERLSEKLTDALKENPDVDFALNIVSHPPANRKLFSSVLLACARVAYDHICSLQAQKPNAFLLASYAFYYARELFTSGLYHDALAVASKGAEVCKGDSRSLGASSLRLLPDLLLLAADAGNRSNDLRSAVDYGTGFLDWIKFYSFQWLRGYDVCSATRIVCKSQVALGEYDQAIRYTKSVLEFFEKEVVDRCVQLLGFHRSHLLRTLALCYTHALMRAEALEACEESVSICRSLCAISSDERIVPPEFGRFPFSSETELGQSLQVLGDIHGMEPANPSGAISCFEESIILLVPEFRKNPSGWEDFFAQLYWSYIAACEADNYVPDESLLTSVARVFEDSGNE